MEKNNNNNYQDNPYYRESLFVAKIELIFFFIDTKHSSLIKHVGRLDGVERRKEKKKKEKGNTANFNIEAK